MRKGLISAVTAGVLVGLTGSTASAAPINLVINGDFESGNTGFETTYNYAPAFNQYEGEYTVAGNPMLWHMYFAWASDRSGTGNMLLANGALGVNTVWSQSVSVKQDTDYAFGASAFDACCNIYYDNISVVRASVLGLFANGELVMFLRQGGPGVWIDNAGVWGSGDSQTALLEVRDLNFDPNGNDFAIDNIFFSELDLPREVQIDAANPEPATWTLMALGGLAAVWARRRQSRA